MIYKISTKNIWIIYFDKFSYNIMISKNTKLVRPEDERIKANFHSALLVERWLYLYCGSFLTQSDPKS